jgi:hypothetical protein
MLSQHDAANLELTNFLSGFYSRIWLDDSEYGGFVSPCGVSDGILGKL